MHCASILVSNIPSTLLQNGNKCACGHVAMITHTTVVSTQYILFIMQHAY